MNLFREGEENRFQVNSVVREHRAFGFDLMSPLEEEKHQIPGGFAYGADS